MKMGAGEGARRTGDRDGPGLGLMRVANPVVSEVVAALAFSVVGPFLGCAEVDVSSETGKGSRVGMEMGAGAGGARGTGDGDGSGAEKIAFGYRFESLYLPKKNMITHWCKRDTGR